MKKLIISSLLSVSVLSLGGCAAISTAVSHRNLETKTQMSSSIFIPPSEQQKKVVYLDVKNTSDQSSFNIADDLKADLKAKGYTVTSDYKKAGYLVQVNMLKVGKIDPSAAASALGAGFGGALEGAAAGAAIGSFGGGDTAVAGGLLGGILGTVANSAVKDVQYSAITDVQIGVHSDKLITSHTQSNLSQGTQSQETQNTTTEGHWRYYRTRVLSTADKVNLDFKDAQPKLQASIAHSIANIL